MTPPALVLLICNHCADELDLHAAEEVAAWRFEDRLSRWVLCTQCRELELFECVDCGQPMTAERAFGALCLDCLEGK
jgi:hypothetical protein